MVGEGKETMQTNIQQLAACVATIKRLEHPECTAHSMLGAWRDLRDAIMRDAPSGSGIDCGTKLVPERCTPTRVVLSCEFHHMNDAGMYSGWTEHTVTITPTFESIHVAVSGRNRNGIKDYLADTYYHWATAECPHHFTLPPRDEA